MDGTVLTCRLHQSRLALLPVAVLHHLEEKGVRVGRVARAGPTSVMHDVSWYLLHQVLERDLCELQWKDILDQVRITFSDSRRIRSPAPNTGTCTFELRFPIVTGSLLVVVAMPRCWEW